MNYLKIIKEDIANGPGIRVSLFVSGCPHKCKGCFNKESWDDLAGKLFTYNQSKEILKSLDKDYISGLSILGGEPLAPKNRFEIACLINKIKRKYPDKTIWCWTGYDYEYLLEKSKNSYYLSFILNNIDVLIDGKFIEEKKDISLMYRGSSNQRIIYLKPKSSF